MKKKVGDTVTLWLTGYIQVQGKIVELLPKGRVMIDQTDNMGNNFCGVPV